MSESKFTQKQKNEILKKVEQKTNQYYEEGQHVKEQKDADAILEKEFTNL